MLLTFAGRNIFHRTVVIVWCCPLSWKRKIDSRTGFKTSSFSSLFPFILVLFFFFDLESFFFFSCDAICINNGILLFDWCSLPKVDLKCHAPSDDTFLATNKRCDVWGGQGVKTKTNLATVAWGDGLILFKIVAKHYAMPACSIFYLTEHFGAFWRVQWKNAAQTEVSHIFQNVFLEKYSTYEGEIWPLCSTCCINWSLQPVAKMLRHLTWKTLFLTKHRIKSYICKIKQLPSPSPIFNVVLRKFQHDLLLWPTLRRERGGLKREDLINTLDVQIRYNVSSLFATGCLNAEVSCYSISRLS